MAATNENPLSPPSTKVIEEARAIIEAMKTTPEDPMPGYAGSTIMAPCNRPPRQTQDRWALKKAQGYRGFVQIEEEELAGR